MFLDEGHHAVSPSSISWLGDGFDHLRHAHGGDGGAGGNKKKKRSRASVTTAQAHARAVARQQVGWG
jgi:hypothetical protein